MNLNHEIPLFNRVPQLQLICKTQTKTPIKQILTIQINKPIQLKKLKIVLQKNLNKETKTKMLRIHKPKTNKAINKIQRRSGNQKLMCENEQRSILY